MAISKEVLNGSENTLYQNVSSDQIQITVDKMKLKLEAYEKSSRKSVEWYTWLGIFLTAIASLNAATFTETLGINADTWHAIFIIISLISFIMIVYSITSSFKNRMTIDDFINDCKNSE